MHTTTASELCMHELIFTYVQKDRHQNISAKIENIILRSLTVKLLAAE